MESRTVRVRHLSSRENPVYKRLRSLREGGRSGRESGLMLLEGPHLLSAALAAGQRAELLALRKTWESDEEIRSLVAMADAPELVVMDDSLFRDLSDLVSPPRLLAILGIPERRQGPEAGNCVVLCGIQDPGNAGTILRSAAAAGIGQAVFTKGSVAAWSPRVLRAGQGAHFALRIVETADLAASLSGYAGRIVATVARGGRPPWAIDLTGPVAWLFGSEGAGLPDEATRLADTLVTLPMAAASESLNVAAAAAVCFFEAVRQTEVST
ncbi:MAG: RNA methyltransferase [Rhodocyclaceae bacterium]|nr:RNA methyltransferase [Rhodocyclaceae bacterium]